MQSPGGEKEGAVNVCAKASGSEQDDEGSGNPSKALPESGTLRDPGGGSDECLNAFFSLP